MITGRRAGLSVAIAIAALGLLWAGPASGKTRPAKRAERGVRLVTKDLDRVLVKARDQLAELARLPSVQSQDAAACTAHMEARAGSPRYTALGAADSTGDLYCLSEPFTSPVSIADRPYFLRARESHSGFGVGDYQIGRATGERSLGVGRAVVDQFFVGVTGVVISPIALDWLDAHVEQKRPRGAFDVLVVDSHGTVLARAGHGVQDVGHNLAYSVLVTRMIKHGRGSGRFSIAGEPVRSAFRIVPHSGGAVRVAVSVRR